MSLRLEGIRAGYGRSIVLHGIDLVVPAGRAVALLGPNGAGKTTLLRVIAGLLVPETGRILLNGRPLAPATHRRSRQGICLIPEGRGVFRHLTVRENIAMFARGHDVPGAVDHVIDVFPTLADRLAQRAGTLSGGQQQMLAMSRAFISGADLVLADELSVGLAPIVVDEVFTAIERLKQAGRSILLVEQYVDRALAEVEVAYVLHKGTITFAGESQECTAGLIYERYLGSSHQPA